MTDKESPIKAPKEVPKEVPKEKPKAESKDEFREIVRVANTDVNGRVTIERALIKIKGIGKRYARAIMLNFCESAKLPLDIKVGNISPKLDVMLDELVKNPKMLPEWMLNRRKDTYDGKTSQLLGSDLLFIDREDLMRLSKIKSRRGLRRMAKLPARGQKTHSNFKRGTSKGKGPKKKSK
jgi:small subunit ribosomal protein S13